MSQTTIRDMTDLITPHLKWCERIQEYSPRTVEARRSVLVRADKQLPCGINIASVDELSDWLHQYRDPQTRHTYHGHLGGFYSWGLEYGHLTWNPMQSIPVPKVPKRAPRPVSDDELRFLLDNAADPFLLWCILAAGAGLRALEISRLERRDVTEHTITVVCGKGGKTDVLPTHPLIWEKVKDLPPGPVARNAHGRPVTPRFISSRFGRYLRKKLGLDGITLHRCRHWYGTALNRGANTRTAQKGLRHDSLTSTQIYTDVADGELRTAIRQLPVLLGAPASR